MKPTLPLLLGLAALAPAAFAADHRDSPMVIDDPAVDINDVYAFINPNNPNELVLAATILPIADAGSRFSDAATYRFNLEAGRNKRKTTITCTFPEGTQVRCTHDIAGTVTGDVGEVVGGGNLRVFAGLRDDPFFFDLEAFVETRDTLMPAFTDPGENFFEGLDTLALVVGINRRLLGQVRPPVVSVWASSEREAPGFRTGNVQVDRMGRPAINTALIDLLADTGKKEKYNRAANPAGWGQFQQEMADNLAALDTLDGAENALLPPDTLASVLVDDRLYVDTQYAFCDAYLAVELGVGGQCGGRTLSRDVMDDTLGAVVGPGVSDFVANDSAFLPDFPFLGEPNLVN